MPNGESTKHASTKATQKQVIQWMMSTSTKEGEFGLMEKCLKEFPLHFQHKNYHANIMRASKWWKVCVDFFQN